MPPRRPPLLLPLALLAALCLAAPAQEPPLPEPELEMNLETPPADTPEPPAPGIDLQMHFNAGWKARYQTTSGQTITQNIAEPPIVVRTDLTLDWEWAADGVDMADGAGRLRGRLLRARVSLDGPGLKADWDSDDPAQELVPPFAAGFAAIVGAEFTVRMSTGGRVIAWDGVDAARDENLPLMGASPATPAGQKVAAALRPFFGDAPFQAAWEMWTAWRPRAPVQMGANWEVVFPASGVMTLAGEPAGQAILQRQRDGFWVMAVSRPLVMSVGGPETPDGSSRCSLTGVEAGDMALDPVTGWPEWGGFQATLLGEARAGDRRWPVKMETESTLRRTGP